MGIIKIYNSKMDTTYVYENLSYWDSEKKQARSKRKLIGKIDKETGQVVPTGKRGRPRLKTNNPEDMTDVRNVVNALNTLNSINAFNEANGISFSEDSPNGENMLSPMNLLEEIQKYQDLYERGQQIIADKDKQIQELKIKQQQLVESYRTTIDAMKASLKQIIIG